MRTEHPPVSVLQAQDDVLTSRLVLAAFQRTPRSLDALWDTKEKILRDGVDTALRELAQAEISVWLATLRLEEDEDTP
jgi:hypothetical protein